jgi:hypothetical protein
MEHIMVAGIGHVKFKRQNVDIAEAEGSLFC